MKIAVTGHTSGLGKSFFDILNSQGHEVLGFSKSNGYDLRDYSRVSTMIDLVRGFDFFINNAKPDYAQSQILYRLAREWKSGTVLSIGSKAVVNYPGWTDTYLLEYLTQKIALAHAHQMLEPVSNCNLILIHPNHITDTNRCASDILSQLEL